MNTKLRPVGDLRVEELRYERKFAVDLEDILSYLYMIKVHPSLFTESHAERRVNSVYFDTEDYSYYADTSVGKTERQKVRLRWYGETIDYISDGKIEIKAKQGFLGSKETFDLGNFATDDLLSHYRNYINASEDLDPAYKQLFSLLRPILISSYLRRYFVSADKNFRITLDYALCFYDVQTGFNPLKKVPSDVCVLELKYQYEHDALARTITNSIPTRYAKSSKYRIGLESL